MTSAVRHNSSFGTRPLANGADGTGYRAKVKKHPVSFKDSMSNEKRSTSDSNSGRNCAKNDYSLLGDNEQTCSLMD